MKICSVTGCGIQAVKRGFCNKHHLRDKRHGSPTAGRICTEFTSVEHRRERKRELARQDYERHKDAYKARAERWRADNPGYYRQTKEAYFTRDDIKARMRAMSVQWRKDNPERKRASDKVFNEANKALVRSYKAKRRAAVLQATPPWLTKQQIADIALLYAEAERKFLETGIDHQVDHFVPLQGGTVCGLHVAWNMRVITADDNNRRPRLWNVDAQDCV